MRDSISKAVLLSRYAAQLEMGVYFVPVNLYCSIETLARFLQLSSLLVNQAQIVVRRRVRRVQSCCFQILLERGAGLMSAHGFAQVAAKEDKKQYQKEERAGEQSEERHQNRPYE